MTLENCMVGELCMLKILKWTGITILVLIIIVFIRTYLLVSQPTRSVIDNQGYTIFYGCLGVLRENTCYGVEQVLSKAVVLD